MTDNKAIQAVVDAQADDLGLWVPPGTIVEAMLQNALRRLHAVIEGKSGDDIAKELLDSLQPGKADD